VRHTYKGTRTPGLTELFNYLVITTAPAQSL
jgi:hypothetical protein